MGITRLAFVGLAVLLLVALIVIGARALLSALGSGDVPEPAPSPSAPATAPATPAETARPQSTGTQSTGTQNTGVPTVRIVCEADRCPVFVRVPGGDVLIDRDLTQDEQASYFEPELDVVLGDGSAVQVFENGKPRAAGKPGERESFKVTRARDR
ncbi:hypothetical protein [Sphaerimonospora thailandensis]|uniref:DUF4115 domain-containing protein n=1 Tax=Sphaerimonospora thailandensis TaxID=795644 RepID=A0A8J3W2W9_9ACTN|nr:hypothetical protein [Sphaerimonospora thailandensis]GIH73246.1 hypothetical protein Mth01_54990 [Sphaerimonospora thailandensis]